MSWPPLLCGVLGLALMLVVLERKHLLAGQVPQFLLTLLVSLVVVLPVLFVLFSVIAYSFKGRAFETGMSLLVLGVGLGVVLLGWFLAGPAARWLIVVGVTVMTCAALTLLP